jgi:hypothetical protein
MKRDWSAQPDGMSDKFNVTQKDVDAVASFVEAANELDLEPFFGKDEQFSLSGIPSAGPATFHLGDRFHFRSALISFRRIWMATEPSHWENVIRILTRAGMPAEVSNNASIQGQLIKVLTSRNAGFLKEITGKKVIELWLNTVFAHGGIKGRNKRRDFEAAVDRYGQGRFEYSFRTLVKQIGEAFRFLSSNAAKPGLDFFRDHLSMQASFRIDAAFGTKRKEITKNGDVIIRQASSEHFSEESFEQRFHRILKRRHFETIKNIVDAFDRTVVELASALFGCNSFSTFVDKLGGGLETTTDDLLDNAVVRKTIAEGFSAGCGVQEGPFMTFGYAWSSRQARVRTNPDAVQALDRLLTAFKNEVLED